MCIEKRIIRVRSNVLTPEQNIIPQIKLQKTMDSKLVKGQEVSQSCTGRTKTNINFYRPKPGQVPVAGKQLRELQG
jgi:hypothetical protein